MDGSNDTEILEVMTTAYKEHMPATTVEEKAAVNAAKEAKKEQTKREEAAKKAMQNPVSTGGGTNTTNTTNTTNNPIPIWPIAIALTFKMLIMRTSGSEGEEFLTATSNDLENKEKNDDSLFKR
jgi:hypothetical protein